MEESLLHLIESHNLNISTVISPKLELIDQYGDEKYIKNDLEKNKLRKMLNRVRFNELVVGSNFKSNLGVLMPCFGYYGMIHGDSIFQSDCIDRNIFRGISVLNLNNSSNALITEDLLHLFLKHVNLHIRDYQISNFAWLGLYERTSCSSDSQYCLVVVCGLSDTEYEEFETTIQKFYSNQQTVTKCASEVFPVYREKARNRRRMLLGIMYDIFKMLTQQVTLGVESVKKESISVDGKTSSIVTTNQYQQMKLYYCGLIYSNSKFPSRMANLLDGCTFWGQPIGNIGVDHQDRDVKKTETFVQVTMDVILDDYKELESEQMDMYIRCSGHATSRDSEVKPILKGPRDVISLYTTENLGNIYACQVYPVFSEQKTTEYKLFVSEDPTIKTPRLLHGVFSQEVIQPTEQLRPRCVRVSIKDDIGLVYLTSQKNAELYSKLCIEPYDAIL